MSDSPFTRLQACGWNFGVASADPKACPKKVSMAQRICLFSDISWSQISACTHSTISFRSR
jgi:hypothetical protein